jgi:hypothetical protein
LKDHVGGALGQQSVARFSLPQFLFDPLLLGDVFVGADRAAGAERNGVDFKNGPVRPCAFVDVPHPESSRNRTGRVVERRLEKLSARALIGDHLVGARPSRHQTRRQIEEFQSAGVVDRQSGIVVDHDEALIHIVERRLQQSALAGELVRPPR